MWATRTGCVAAYPALPQRRKTGVDLEIWGGSNGAKQRARAMPPCCCRAGNTVPFGSRTTGWCHNLCGDARRSRTPFCRNGGNPRPNSPCEMPSPNGHRAPTERAHQTSSSSCSMISAAQAGCYGSDLETPNLDRIAERGIRHEFTPRRSAHQRVLADRAQPPPSRHGMLPDLPVNFPGYTGTFPDNAATIVRP